MSLLEEAPVQRRPTYEGSEVEHQWVIKVRNDFISGLSVDQSIPGRILGYGTIVVNGEGDESVGFPYIRDPQGLRNTIQSHLAEAA